MHNITCDVVSYAWFPALRFRSSVQIGSSSIFSVSVTTRPEAPPTRKRGKLAGHPGLLPIRHAHSPIQGTATA